MMIIPGAMALYSGLSLLKEVTKEGIKGSVGALIPFLRRNEQMLSIGAGASCLRRKRLEAASTKGFNCGGWKPPPHYCSASIGANQMADGISIFAAFWAAENIDKFFLPENSNMLSLLLAMAIIIPLYILISKQLFATENFIVAGRDEFIGKGILTLAAWMIFLSLSEFVNHYAPAKEGFTHIKEEPWDTLGFIGSIIFAWAFYKITSKVLTRKKVDQDGVVNSEPAPLRD